jgi:hypothetical protein
MQISKIVCTTSPFKSPNQSPCSKSKPILFLIPLNILYKKREIVCSFKTLMKGINYHSSDMADKGEEVSQRDRNKVVGSKVDGGTDLLPTTAPNNTCNQRKAIFENFSEFISGFMSCIMRVTNSIFLVVHCKFITCQWDSHAVYLKVVPCTQSNKNEIARSGSILAMYLITLSSLLYA